MVQRIKVIENPQEILECESVPKNIRDLVGKILELEKDKERINWVKFGIPEETTLDNLGKEMIYGKVNLLQYSFRDCDHFLEYLNNHHINLFSLKGGSVAKSGEGRYSLMFEYQLLVEFEKDVLLES